MTFGERELTLLSASAILQDIAPDVLLATLKNRPEDQFVLPPATTFIEAGQVKPGLYLPGFDESRCRRQDDLVVGAAAERRQKHVGRDVLQDRRRPGQCQLAISKAHWLSPLRRSLSSAA